MYSGGRAALCAKALLDLGYVDVRILGAYKDWFEAGLAQVIKEILRAAIGIDIQRPAKVQAARALMDLVYYRNGNTG